MIHRKRYINKMAKLSVGELLNLPNIFLNIDKGIQLTFRD